jgi:arylsulfatase A-like enzyme
LPWTVAIGSGLAGLAEAAVLLLGGGVGARSVPGRLEYLAATALIYGILGLVWGGLAAPALWILRRVRPLAGERVQSCLRCAVIGAATLGIAATHLNISYFPAFLSRTSLLGNSALLLSYAAICCACGLRLSRAAARPPEPAWMSARRFGLTAGGLALAVLGACLAWPAPAAAAGAAEHPNILLLSLDTVRADHLGAYGYHRPTSPHLDRVAAEGAVFLNAYAPEPWTLPSHMTLMTSRYPLAHQVRSWNSRLNPSVTTLAQALHRAGYETAAFVDTSANGWLGASFGFDSGFDLYEHEPHLLGNYGRLAAAQCLFNSGALPPNRASFTTRAAIQWLRTRGPEPFFLFLHYYDVHSDIGRLPYEAPEGYRDLFTGDYHGSFSGCDREGRCASEFLLQATGRLASGEPVESVLRREDLAYIVDLYDAQIVYLDHYVGELLQYLESAGLKDSTIIAIVSDHGEEFLEHGRLAHHQLYEEVLHIPFLVRWPRSVPAGARVPQSMGLVDVAPTLLDLAGLEMPATFQGQPRVDWIKGSSSLDHPAAVYATLSQGCPPFRMTGAVVRVGPNKLVLRATDLGPDSSWEPRLELYNLADDPLEQHDLSRLDAGLARSLETNLQGWMRDLENLASLSPARQLDSGMVLGEEAMRQLRCLGYVQ